MARFCGRVNNLEDNIFHHLSVFLKGPLVTCVTLNFKNMKMFLQYIARQIQKLDTAHIDQYDIGPPEFHNGPISNHPNQPQQPYYESRVPQGPVAPIAPITTNITPLTINGVQMCDERGYVLYYNIQNGKGTVYASGSGALVQIDFSNRRSYYCFILQNGAHQRAGYGGYGVTFRVDSTTNYLELEKQLNATTFQHYMTFNLSTTPPTLLNGTF